MLVRKQNGTATTFGVVVETTPYKEYNEEQVKQVMNVLAAVRPAIEVPVHVAQLAIPPNKALVLVHEVQAPVLKSP